MKVIGYSFLVALVLAFFGPHVPGVFPTALILTPFVVLVFFICKALRITFDTAKRNNFDVGDTVEEIATDAVEQVAKVPVNAVKNVLEKRK